MMGIFKIGMTLYVICNFEHKEIVEYLHVYHLQLSKNPRNGPTCLHQTPSVHTSATMLGYGLHVQLSWHYRHVPCNARHSVWHADGSSGFDSRDCL